MFKKSFTPGFVFGALSVKFLLKLENSATIIITSTITLNLLEEAVYAACFREFVI